MSKEQEKERKEYKKACGLIRKEYHTYPENEKKIHDFIQMTNSIQARFRKIEGKPYYEDRRKK
jgi:hypothetical protein